MSAFDLRLTEELGEEKSREELKANLQKNAGQAFEVFLSPGTSSDIPDNKNLKLAIFAPEFSYDSGEGKRFAAELLERVGIGFRVYKNTLFILAMDNGEYLALSRFLKRFLALTAIQADKGLLETLTKGSGQNA